MKIELKINGTDVSRDLEKFPHALTYEDAQSGETDSLTLELMDRARLFIGDWLPEKGATIQAALINGDKTFPLGTFEVDEIEFSTPPSVMKIKANSCSQNSELRQVEMSRAWENVLLSKICADIAQASGVELFYKTDFDPEIKRAEQGELSRLAFLEKLCKDYGLIVKFADNQIIVVEESALESAEPVETFTPDKIKKISFKSTLTEIYKACELNYPYKVSA